jgi:hypothetical protein
MRIQTLSLPSRLAASRPTALELPAATAMSVDPYFRTRWALDQPVAAYLQDRHSLASTQRSKTGLLGRLRTLRYHHYDEELLGDRRAKEFGLAYFAPQRTRFDAASNQLSA